MRVVRANPHPLADVTTASEQTLATLSVLYRGGTVAPQRLRLAGIPPLAEVLAEQQRRVRVVREAA